MNDDRMELEQTVRAALRDAAEHAPLESGVPLTDMRERQPRQLPRRGRVRYLVAAVAAAIVVVAVGAAVVAGDGDGGRVRVAAPAGEPREVSVEQLPRSATSLFVYFVVDATDEQVAGVRTLLDTSPDVVHYAWLDHDAAQRDFAELYACQPDLVDSVSPENLPVSFRVSTIDADAAARVQIALGNAPGVELVDTRTESYAIPARSDQTVTSGYPSPCVGDGGVVHAEPLPSTPITAPTLPPAGDPPADPTGSRDAVVAAFTQAWNGALSVDERRAAMQDAAVLAPELDQARTGNESSIAMMDATIEDVTFVAPDRAAVVFHIDIGPSRYPSQLGYAVLEDDGWKVSRETVCGVLTIAAVSCPSR